LVLPKKNGGSKDEQASDANHKREEKAPCNCSGACRKFLL
jgi:hypothetical protein